MARYTRSFVPGGTFFFTLVTYHRRPIFKDARARDLLHKAIEDVRSRRPFELDAVVLMPDHMHCLWTLPPGDADFSGSVTLSVGSGYRLRTASVNERSRCQANHRTAP